MRTANLIPARRIIARQRRLHVRRCVIGCIAWTMLAGGLCAMGGNFFGSRDDSIETRIIKADKDIDLARTTLEAVRADMSAAQATLRATRSIANQPDWSLLLALLGQTTGEEVVLRSFDLKPIIPDAPKPVAKAASPANAGANAKPNAKAEPRTARFQLNANGLGRSQLAVTQFVLRLEKLGLFSRVTLLDTSREPFLDGQATSFRIECILGDELSRQSDRGKL